MLLNKIIKSRLTNKSKLPPWYKKRVDICKKCPFYFHNKKRKTIKNYWWYLLNMFSAQCTICNCAVKQKASIAEECCAKEHIGEKPLWDIEKHP
jgi:hypothetical protein